MIIRLIAVDPRPRKGESDIRVYQVPEFSREMELLVELFELASIEWTAVSSSPAPKRRKKD